MRKKVLLTLSLFATLMSVSTSLFAAKPPAEDGNCAPEKDWVCGMNGQNFVDKWKL